MILDLDIPVSMSDKELTKILNNLNRLGIPHHLEATAWYSRRIIIELKPENIQLALGIAIGRQLGLKRK